MVTVTEVLERKNKDGESFIALMLDGGLELVKSSNTGRYYATCRRASMVSTFTMEQAKSFVGHKISGKIERVPCKPYDFELDSGEVIELDFSYQYMQDTSDIVEEVVG